MKIHIVICLVMFISATFGCQDTSMNPKNINNDLIIRSTPVSAIPFVGIGPQWGGYDNILRWTGSSTFNTKDWEALEERVQFLRPGLVRIMASQGWNYYQNGVYSPAISEGVLFRILDFCQENGIQVMYGEWGEEALPNGEVDAAWLERSTDFLKYLLDTRGYTCLKYYNMCNEPAGDWSSIGGDYSLWQRTYEQLLSLMEAKGLNNRIEVIAPDVAIWNDTSLSDWITRPAAYFGDKIQAYDIHSYPTDDQVKGGSYRKVIAHYRSIVPDGKAMIMGELGFKYNPNSAHGITNVARIADDPFAGDDSNMMIYDAFYGVDVADAVVQNMLAGYDGVILWNMDDAMYSDNGDKLKRWGFWNIFGEEKFGSSADEAIRPWFYPMSLLCRYFPNGSTIYPVDVPEKKGLQAVSAKKDGRTTIALVNSHASSYTLHLKAEERLHLQGAKVYQYIAGDGASFEGAKDSKGFAIPNSVEDIDLHQDDAFTVQLPGRSVMLITTMP